MIIAWYIVPYKRQYFVEWQPGQFIPVAMPRRYAAIGDYTAEICGAGGSWAETEILGDRCLVKVRAPAEVLATLDAVYQRLPKQRLDDPLSDLSAAAKQKLKNAVLGMGYSVGELQAAFPGDLGDYCLGDVLHFMASRRLKPRYDAQADEIVCDGEVQGCRPVGDVDREVRE
jgi:hypothetical protein